MRINAFPGAPTTWLPQCSTPLVSRMFGTSTVLLPSFCTTPASTSQVASEHRPFRPNPPQPSDKPIRRARQRQLSNAVSGCVSTTPLPFSLGHSARRAVPGTGTRWSLNGACSSYPSPSKRHQTKLSKRDIRGVRFFFFIVPPLYELSDTTKVKKS